MSRELVSQFEKLIHHDPAGRGLIGNGRGPLCAGHLYEAAEHLANHATHVGIVTGFYVPHGEVPAAETDGPLGAFVLASALGAAGIDVVVITDEHCRGAIEAIAERTGFPLDRIHIFPTDNADWTEQFFTTGAGAELTHLISIERVGPSHHAESIALQTRSSEVAVEEFHLRVSVESHNTCHNMRGECIGEYTANIHVLFEEILRFRPNAKTIGIGDGANEIGMGTIPWEELVVRLNGEHAAKIPCRITTDWNIVAGTSNWGGYALAAATLLLREESHQLRDWDPQRILDVLTHLVEFGPAVDGVTRQRTPTVDGLPFETYIQPWCEMRRLMRLDDEIANPSQNEVNSGMTGYTVHTGSTEKFSEGWDTIFGKKAMAKDGAGKPAKKKTVRNKKKTATKKSAKGKAAGKRTGKAKKK